MTRALILVTGLLLAGSTSTLTQAVPSAAELDTLLGPVALYPDQLLGPMLVCAGNPGKVAALSEWMRSQSLKGSDLQSAASESGFDDCHAALVLFPDVVHWMESQPAWMSTVGGVFATDREAIFASIQRLRGKAKAAGALQSTPQQSVETKTTSSGDQVIVIEPANSEIVYVPQYNAQTVYTQPSTVVVQQGSTANAALAGAIGFTAGVAIGAMWDNNYYYGRYGWRGAGMYNDAWDDWYDHREDARDDWQDHREDMADEYGDRRKNAQDNRTERRENTQNQRTERQQNRQENGTTGARTQRQQQRSSSTAATQAAGVRTQETRGFSSDTRPGSTRSGTASTAFSGYSSGRSERAASSRGQRSRSSARSGGSRRR